MNQTRATYIGVSVSVFLHLCFICSTDLRTVMFLNLMGEPETRQADKIVFDLETAPVPPPAPLKPVTPVVAPAPPKPKKFVDMPIAQKDSPAPKQTDLIGEKNSLARDKAPTDKKPDGTPRLEGKSEAIGTRNVPQSSGPFNPGAPGAVALLPSPTILKSEPPPPKPEKTPPKETPAKPEVKTAMPPKETPSKAVEKTPASPPKSPSSEVKAAEVKAPPRPTPAPKQSPSPAVAPPAPAARAETLAKGPQVKDKDVRPEGVLPRTAPGKEAKRRKTGPETKIEVETKPADKPLQVASLPAPVPPPSETPQRPAGPAPEAAPPAPSQRPEGKAEVLQKQMLNSRMLATMPQPFSPPPMSPQARQNSPGSSAGEKGEEAFNVKMHEYAKYYKHISQKVGSTLDILYGGDISMITPKPTMEKVVVDFRILRTGEITDVKLMYDGGDLVLSSMIVSSVRGTPLDPFPKYIKEDHLKIRYTFYFR